MEDIIYRRLAEHLDGLPGGFAPSENGADLKLLRRLFTPPEAELAVHLTLDQEEAGTIAARAGLPPAVTQARLEQMADKGLIMSVQRPEGALRYQAIPFVVGIYEFQLNRLDEAMLRDITDYWDSPKTSWPVETIAQMRTIPVGQSVEFQPEVLPYEQIGALVAAQDRFTVVPCICRRAAKMKGQGCDAPEETCLSFGDFAEYLARTGRGRAIDRAEVLDILKRADAANLVLSPSNSREMSFVCACCGCCCGVLHGLQRTPKPSEIVVNDWIARLEPETCQNCERCLERCQMQAFSAGPEHVSLNADRCIGCGLCVSTCPSGALTLALKPGRERVAPPATMSDTWQIIAQTQAQGRAADER